MPDLVQAAAAALGVPVTSVSDGLPATGKARRIVLQMGDGSVLPCVVKAAGATEARLYREGLDPATTGAPALLGAVGDLLFLEELPETYPDFADPADVVTTYRHLAALHHQQFRRTGWPDRPETLLHGDYHRWNLLKEGARIRVLDWEHAAVGHPILDVTLLAPEEPGWDGVPRGALAELALRTYHAAGPLAHLPWPAFLRLQRLARLYAAARRLGAHLERAAAAGPGAAEALQAHISDEQARMSALAHLLQL